MDWKAKAALAALIGFSIQQAAAMAWQAWERRSKYRQAQEYAERVGKPMLVVGGPWGDNPFRSFLRIPAHGCGDFCLDIDPRACQGCNYVQADVRDIPFPSGFFGSALASHVLEHLPTVADAEKAISELQRVAGLVLVASPTRHSVIAWGVPSHHLWVRQGSDGSIALEQRDSRQAGRRLLESLPGR